MKPFRFLFVVLFAVSLALALSSAASLPAAHATHDVPDGLSAADWAQIKSQLAPEAIATWDEQAKLTASDAAAKDGFGGSVAVSGNTVVVGAPLDSEGGWDSGSAYVFVRSGGSWNQQAKLTASDPAIGDRFGWAVAVNGDTAVVGAPYKGTHNDTGSAYVFVRSGESWSQEAKLTASGSNRERWFGYSIAISGDTAVIGAPFDNGGFSYSGAAYVFVRSEGSWSEQSKLTASDTTIDDHLGWSVAISGDTAVVGAPYDDDNGDESGSAYIFVRNETSWSQQAKLTASDAVTDDYFGSSVAVSSDTAVIGALWSDNNGIDSGSAYVFVRSGMSWSEQAKLIASDSGANDWFGFPVAISGDTAVISAPRDDDNGTDSGSAYIFVRSGEIWSQEAKLTANDAAAEDFFGGSVVVSGDTIVVGVSGNDAGGANSGAAYVFSSSYPLTVATSSMGSGSIVSNPSGIDCGLTCENYFPIDAVITLTATAETESIFVGWSGDVVTTTNPITITMDGAKAITATFALNQYALNVATVGNGTAAPNSGTYDYGTVVTLTATADLGSTFTGWSGDVLTTTNPITVTMDGAKAITATFALNQYTITLSAEPTAGGTVTGGGSVTHGQMVTATATAETGYTFLHWAEGGDVVSTAANYSFTATAERALVAHFAADAPKIYLPLIVR